MSRRLQTYEGEGFAVTFDPSLCIHSGNCVRGLPAVFDVRRKRWVAVEAASAEAIEAQIRRCPSGALQFVRTTAGHDEAGSHDEHGFRTRMERPETAG